MMHVIDQNIERLELQQTQPGVTPTASMICLALLLSYGLARSGEDFLAKSRFAVKQTDETSTALNYTTRISDLDLLSVLRTVHDKLLEQSVDLDSGAREILYKNLSKLYKYA